MIFDDRNQAAEILAERLLTYKGRHPLVLGIPRGAIPMAKVIARALEGEVDAVLVRKLGYPGQPELAVGAIDESGTIFLADYAADVESSYLEAEKRDQLEILRQRRRLYTPARPPTDPRDRVVIVVDDGIATGATMLTALRALRAKSPKELVAAVAVASQQALHAVAPECDSVVCLDVPEDFYAVGRFFRDFSQVSDEDVVASLQSARD